jgi:hypothetical protein
MEAALIVSSRLEPFCMPLLTLAPPVDRTSLIHFNVLKLSSAVVVDYSEG